MRKPIFTGAGVAIITPFTENGVNYDKLGELIEFQIRKVSTHHNLRYHRRSIDNA